MGMQCFFHSVLEDNTNEGFLSMILAESVEVAFKVTRF